MAKVYLFGSASLNSVAGLESILQSLMEQGHEFIVADGRGADSAFHLSLSRIGALDKTTLYIMNRTFNNKYDLKTRVIKTSIDAEKKEAYLLDGNTNEVIGTIEGIEQIEDLDGNQQYSEFRDRLMMDECAIGICAWAGDSKREFKRIQLMGIKNKPCYTYKF